MIKLIGGYVCEVVAPAYLFKVRFKNMKIRFLENLRKYTVHIELSFIYHVVGRGIAKVIFVEHFKVLKSNRKNEENIERQ